MKTRTQASRPSAVITTAELCDRFKVNQRWVERHIECGDLKPLKAGRLNRFYVDEVIAYFERERAEAVR